jgi:DNA-binding MarR family transcriptional regulator
LTNRPGIGQAVGMGAPFDPDSVPLPALLRAARGAYGQAVVAALARNDFEDMPRNGPYVLGGIVNHAGSARRLVAELGVSKQAASQLIDTLVLRGYLTRRPNDEDRRRVDIEPTDRGRAAAAVIREAVRSIDAELAEAVSERTVRALRAGLFALADIRERTALAARAGSDR